MDTNRILMIDPAARKIEVPEKERIIGVYQDHDSERKYFKCPKIVGDNVDLSQHRIYINYVPSKINGTFNEEEEVGSYCCEDVATDGDYVTFSWRISDNVTREAGYIAFAVFAKKADADGNLETKWHTTPAIGNVLDTLPDGDQIVSRYPDIIEQIMERLDRIGEIDPEQIEDDAEALQVNFLYPEWKSGKDYTAGYRVNHNGVLYKVLQDHTSQDDWAPDAAPSLFTKVLIPDSNVVPEWEQPESTNPYSKGDKVTHNGKTWVSDVDGNVWEPGVYGWIEA